MRKPDKKWGLIGTVKNHREIGPVLRIVVRMARIVVSNHMDVTPIYIYSQRIMNTACITAVK